MFYCNITTQDCTRLKERIAVIVDSFRPEEHKSVFSTKQQTSTTDEYFLNSSGNISCFLEVVLTIPR